MPERRQMMRTALGLAICGVIGWMLVATTLMTTLYESLPTMWTVAKIVFALSFLYGLYVAYFWYRVYVTIIRPRREERLEAAKKAQQITKEAMEIKLRPPTYYDCQRELHAVHIQAVRAESLQRRATLLRRAHEGGGLGRVVMNKCEELIAECEGLLVDSYMGECCSRALEPLVNRLRTWLLVECGADLNLELRAQLATPLKDNEAVIQEAVIPVFVHALVALDSFQQRASTVFEAKPLSTNPEDRPSRITRVHCHLKGNKALKARWLVKKARLLLRKVRAVPCSLEAIDKELQWRRAQLEALRSTVPVKPPPSEAIVPDAGTFVPSKPSRGAASAKLDGAFSEYETSRSVRIAGARPAIFGVARRRLRSIRSRVRLRASPAQACHRRRRLLSRGRRRATRSPTSWIGKSRTTRRTRSRAARRPLRLTFALLEKPPRWRRACAASSPERGRLNRSWAACRWPPTCVVNVASGRAT